MLSTRRYDDSRNGLHDWTFMTVHNWGENPKGVWIMNVTDNLNIMGKRLNAGTFVQHDTSKQAADVEDLEQEVGNESLILEMHLDYYQLPTNITWIVS